MCRDQEDFCGAEQVVELTSLSPIICKTVEDSVLRNAVPMLSYSHLWTCFSCYSDGLDVGEISLRVLGEDGRSAYQCVDLRDTC
jgi:hypothetical protein